MTGRARAWQGSWALGDNWLTYVGPLGQTSPHAHHAIQLIGRRDGTVEAVINGTQAVGQVLVIHSNVPHQIVTAAGEGWVVFIEPRSSLGRKVGTGLRPSATRSIGPIPSDDFADFERFASQSVSHFADPATDDAPRDAHWATVQALAQIPALIAVGSVSASAIANQIGISPSRLSHVFNVDTGMTLPAYVRWVRLRAAVECVTTGATLTHGAHCAGFADAAHLARSFRAMFGLSPSQVVTQGRWLNR